MNTIPLNGISGKDAAKRKKMKQKELIKLRNRLLAWSGTEDGLADIWEKAYRLFCEECNKAIAQVLETGDIEGLSPDALLNCFQAAVDDLDALQKLDMETET
jgi:hypothetical protein